MKKIENNYFGRELLSHFDKIFCINLDARADRWKYVSEHFNEFGLGRVQRFSAVDVRNNPSLKSKEKLLDGNFSLLAMCGCMLSHRKIIEQAKMENLKNILVFEDDIRVLQTNIASIAETLNDLNQQEWDVFYLGATYLWSLENITPYLVRVPNGAYATHAIAYNHTIYDKILDLLPSCPDEFLDSDKYEVNALDKWLQSDMFDRNKFYGSNPIMVVQTLQESDIAFSQQEGIEQTQIDLFNKNH